jgi:hypothetical protein
MVEGETSNPPSLADSPPRVETVNPGEELEEGIEEVPKLAFPEDNESDIEPEGPDEYEDTISQGTADTLAIFQLGDVGMQPFDESCCLCRMTVKSGGRTLLCGSPASTCSR